MRTLTTLLLSLTACGQPAALPSLPYDHAELQRVLDTLQIVAVSRGLNPPAYPADASWHFVRSMDDSPHPECKCVAYTSEVSHEVWVSLVDDLFRNPVDDVAHTPALHEAIHLLWGDGGHTRPELWTGAFFTAWNHLNKTTWRADY